MTARAPGRRRALGFAAALALAPAAAGAGVDALPRDFPLSPVTWGGLGGARDRGGCGPLRHHPVILVHADGEGPEDWTSGPDGGTVGALLRAGFDPCEVWALRLGERGRPLRSLEELTDDLKFFMGSVLAYTRAPRVQVVARGEGAVLAHAALRKYRLHALVHSAIYLDAPFRGLAGCDTARCLSGEVRCCALGEGSLLLRRALSPDEAPDALTVAADQGRQGRIRYLCLGADPAMPLAERAPGRGGWMLDGAVNLSFPGLMGRALHEEAAAWDVVVRALSDPASACDPAADGDGDGFCAPEHGGMDCDDGERGVHPGAEEVEADGVDQDCNGYDTDRRIPGWACERPLQATPVPAPGALPRDSAAARALGARSPVAAPQGDPRPRRLWIRFVGFSLAALGIAAWVVARGARRERRRGGSRAPR